tara:strand:- start:1508 stop:1948 length:441 start_codon:yes stop_codon:yes gene_type:complete
MTLLLISACSSAKDERQHLYNEIVTIEQQFMAAFEQGDASGIAALYEINAQLLPANHEFISGQTAIQSFWRGLMQLGVASVKLETLEVEGMGDHAYEVGRYTIHTSDDEMIDFGKYIVTWRKSDEQWTLYRHIWTTSMIKSNQTRV